MCGHRVRSSHRYLLQILRTRVVCGERAFLAAAPFLWNKLPLKLRTTTSLEKFQVQVEIVPVYSKACHEKCGTYLDSYISSVCLVHLGMEVLVAGAIQMPIISSSSSRSSGLLNPPSQITPSQIYNQYNKILALIYM